MDIFLGIIIGILALAFLVTAHEFGHFIMARRSGVRVNEFGICFPPRAIAWTRGKDGKWHKIPKSDWGKPQKSLILSLNWLPIGGFCSMEGESDADTKKGSFGATSFKNKTKILFGGVAMNWLIAVIIFTILAWTGMPQFLSDQFHLDSDTRISATAPVTVTNVIADSPAARAGFRAGDQIIRAGETDIVVGADVTAYNQAHAGESVTYEVLREDGETADCIPPCETSEKSSLQTLSLTAELNPAEDSEYLLGIAMQSGQSVAYSTWSAPLVGIGTTVQLTDETFRGLGEMVWNLLSGVARQVSFDANVREEGGAALESARDSVSGPVGIIGYLFPGMVSAGPSNLFFLIALISVSLACMNVIPIPALDGGRFLLIAIARLQGKKLEKETEEKIVSRAMYILLILIVLITILDIIRFF